MVVFEGMVFCGLVRTRGIATEHMSSVSSLKIFREWASAIMARTIVISSCLVGKGSLKAPRDWDHGSGLDG